MAYDVNSFPLILSVKSDGGLNGTVKGIEDLLGNAAIKAGSLFEAAGRKADSAFRLSGARADVDTFARSLAALRKEADGAFNRKLSASSDPFGIRAQIAALSSSPLQRVLADQANAEASLAQQRARYQAERIAGIQVEYNAALDAIRAREAAQTAAFQKAEAQGNALIALDRQRIADSAGLVAAPQQLATIYFDPKGSQAAATAARAQASALDQVARAAETASAAANVATASDRAFATTAREAANAAGLEATRLEELAATQGRVAAAATEAGGRIGAAGDLVTRSVGAQRYATLQASQQFQDFFIQIQGGQNPLVAFSQQASQLAFVLSSAGGETGKFAAFMGGPWGTLIFAGLSVLTLLTSGLFDNKSAAEKASDAADLLAKHQQALAAIIDKTTGAVREQNQALLINNSLDAEKDEKSATTRYKALRDQLLTKRFASDSSQDSSVITQVNKVDPRIIAALNQYAAGRSNAAGLARDLFAIGKASPGLKSTTDEYIRLSASIVDTARQGLSAAARKKLLLGDGSDATRKLAFGDFSPDTKSTTNLRSEASTRAVDEGTAALRAAGARRAAALKQLDKDFNVKGGEVDASRAEAYTAAAAAIETKYNADRKAVEDAKAAGSKDRADAKRVAGERRQELFADAAAIGDGTDAIKAANSTYAAEIVHLKNNLREGIISPEAAQASAVAARQVRNAAIEAAGGLKKLGEALVSEFQQQDGESAFVDRYQKTKTDIAKLQKLIDESEVGQISIGDQVYGQDDADRLTRFNEASYLKPITDQNRALTEQAQIDAQILAGHQGEADFLRLKFQILQSYGALNDDDRAAIEAKIEPLRAILDAEYKRSEAIQRQSDLINIQVRAAQDLQSALTDALTDPFAKGGIEKFGAQLTQIRKRAIAETLSVQLFGDLGQKTRDELTRNAPTVEAANALKKSAADLSDAATLLSGKGPTVGQLAATPTAFAGLAAAGASPALLALLGKGNGVTGPGQYGNGTDFPDIVVTGARTVKSVDALAQQTARQNGNFFTFLDKNQVALTYLSGLVGGKAGQAISSIQNISQFKKIGDTLSASITDVLGNSKFAGTVGKALGGAFANIGVGLAIGDTFEALGLKGTKTGAVIGSVLGGPIGGLVGGLIGSLFYKAPSAQAGIKISNGVASTTNLTGNNGDAKNAISSITANVSQGLQTIADALGGILSGSTDVVIGSYKGDIRVNPSGGSATAKYANRNGATSFGDDQAGAIAFAIRAALDDGVITGIRESTRRIIAAGTDLNRQLQKAVAFEGVFTELKQYLDPVGAAVDALDKQFANLRSIFAEAGASTEEYSQLEQLYALKRADAVKQAEQSLVGSLRGLLADLTYKADTGLSLQTREANAAAAFNPLAAAVKAGQRVDQDAFADAARAYLDIERQIYGSTSTYFQQLADITKLTQQAITNAGGTISAIIPKVDVNNPANDNIAGLVTSNPFTDAYQTAFPSTVTGSGGADSGTTAIVTAINQQTTAIGTQTIQLVSRLDTLALAVNNGATVSGYSLASNDAIASPSLRNA